jgi:hypothetical protein
VPYIPREVLQCSIFLYPSKEDAEAGQNWGGSGFLVGVPSAVSKSRVHLYAVSNDHVIHLNPTVRATKADGTMVIVERRDDDWISHLDGDDVAVCPLGVVAVRDYEYVEDEELTLHEAAMNDPWLIGPGDECFMVGRYIYRDQRQFDQPVLRFGNLSMMVEPIRQKERSFNQDSFLVEMRSQSGFSGSPVFVYYEGHGPRIPLPDWWEGNRYEWWKGSPEHWGPGTLPGNRSPSGIVERMWLLGIDWGHIPAWSTVKCENGSEVGKVQVNSGMAGVVPSWKLVDLLVCDDLTKGRAVADEAIRKDEENAGVLDVEDARDTTEEFRRFEAVMRGLVSKPRPKGD